MSACCVSGCKNRHSSTSKLRFYRIPSGYRPFQANRRRLWLQAIQQVNGSAEELKGNSRICGAHFISGEASMDHDSPDFVPSVFKCVKQSESPPKKAKWFYGRRKKRRHTVNAEKEGITSKEITTPPRVESPVDLQSVLMKDIQTPSSPSVPEEGEPLTDEAETETETKTVQSQTTSSPNTASSSSSIKVPINFSKLDKRIPIVLLKSVFAPVGEYQCELCDQTFTSASQLVKHKQRHEDERSFVCEICEKLFTNQADFTEHQRVHKSSFPCNMCDRSFTSSHNLKRHKLLHVKDGRKCRRCGVLFCRRHNHVVFVPQTASEQDSYINEPQHLGDDLMPENNLPEKPEPNQTADLDDITQSTKTITPLLKTTAQTVLPTPPNPGPLSKIRFALPPASQARILSEIPEPVFRKPTSVPRPSLPAPSYSRDDYPATFTQPHLRHHPELPPSLKIFSPQYLTSALLDVERNYEYILSKATNVKKGRDIVKVDQCEPPPTRPDEQSVEHDEKERTAYDLEIVL